MPTNDYAAIRSLLEAQLATVPGIPATDHWAYENDVFTKPVGEQWVWHRVAFGTEELLTRPARGGWLERRGTYRLVLYFPLDDGTDDADTLSQAVVDAFTRGTVLTNGTITLYTEQPRRWTGGRDLEEGWYGVPVDIPWYVQRENPLS